MELEPGEEGEVLISTRLFRFPRVGRHCVSPARPIAGQFVCEAGAIIIEEGAVSAAEGSALAAAMILLAILLAAHPVLAATPPRDPGAAIDRYVKPLVECGHLSGQMLILKNDTVIVERMYGFANSELKAPVTAETAFNIASITKPMTTYLALHLIDEKKIGYHDPLSRWIPDFPGGDSITVELLVRHRAGIPHELVPDSAATQPRTAAEMVEVAKKLPLDFSPGSKSSYSSGGFTVLARILEIAAGESYGDLLQHQIFGPLGMTHSAHTDGRALLPGRAVSYTPGPVGMENAPYQDFSGLVGAGSVWSTTRDLHRFVQAVVSGRLGESMRQSFVRGGRLSFNGRTGGFKSFASWDSTGLETIFLSNAATGAVELLQAALPKILAGEEVPPPVLPEPRIAGVSAADLAAYRGTFQLENGVRLKLVIRNGVLYADDWILLPTGEKTFFSPRDYGTVKGVAGADGRIERLEWTQGDQVYPAPRIGE